MKNIFLKAVPGFLAVVLLLTLGFMIGPANPQSAEAAPPPPATVVYNLYATDGWWIMADGTPLYSYGFVGGRTGDLIYPIKADGEFVNPDGLTVTAPTPGQTLSEFESQVQGHAQFPAPLIRCTVGDNVTITLKNLGVVLGTTALNPNDNNTPVIANAPNDPHSIHLHGMDVDVANDGVPETSVAATPANDVDQIAAGGAGNVVVYNFKPTRAGTYFYHCHQEADIHVDMGMMGVLIVYNKGDAGAMNGPGYAGNLFGFKYDRDVVMLLNDTDVRQHLSEGGIASIVTGNGTISAGLDPDTGAFNPTDYQPQYWFVNMLSFPDTVHASTAQPYNNWIKAHPGYEPMITGSVSNKDKVLVRMINMGFETQPMHMHGFHAKVIGKDQRAWAWANDPGTPAGMGLEENTVTIGSGEVYELLYDFSTVAVTSTYPNTPNLPPAGGGTESRYDSSPLTKDPVSNTRVAQPTILAPELAPDRAPYIAGPVVKGAGAIIPTGVNVPGIGGNGTIGLSQDTAGSQIFVFHNHDDYKATNYGAYPGGQFTVIVPLP